MATTMNRQAKAQLLELLEEKTRRIKFSKIDQFYPEPGTSPLSRDRYPKHMEFFASGATFSERCIIAANRIGKSEGIGAYELTLHLTGRYPSWWIGKRFNRPIKAWAAGATGTTSRDIIQYKLLGAIEEKGTGLIPKKYIENTTPKAGGIPNAVDTILVKHISGGLSRVKIKAYAEGRKSFEGTEQDIIWLDEECPMNIYTECVMRTMTTGGHILFTFTPLEGMTDTVMLFMLDGELGEQSHGSKKLITATWDDAPHLTAAQKKQYFDALPPHQRDARSKGIPQLGSGSIYPILESEITCDPIEIPSNWPRCYALDVGWNKTAALWGAIDPATNIVYIYGEYYRGVAEPIIHTEGIKARGSWIPGVIDPASRGRSQIDGKKLFKEYRKFGLDIKKADNAVETGLQLCWVGLSTGQIKVFSTCKNFFKEFRLYRRDENGKIVKVNDHLMDCLRYLVMSGLKRARIKPINQINATDFWSQVSYTPRDSVIGL